MKALKLLMWLYYKNLWSFISTFKYCAVWRVGIVMCGVWDYIHVRKLFAFEGCMNSLIVPMICPLDSAVKPLEHLEHNSFRFATFFLPPKVNKSKGVELFLFDSP